MKIPIGFLVICALLATGCQRKSGNIWDDNQTGAKYRDENNTSLLWENSAQSGPVADAFIPLNDADLKSQFGDVSAYQTGRELGDAGMPTADQFETPRGNLASIFSPIFFNTDEYVLKDQQSMQIIQRAAAYLKAHPKMYVIVEGHCDERASESYNLALGTRRANYIRSLLLKQGVKADQIHTVSLGKEHPFALGHNPDAWRQNRRAHFRTHQQGS